MTKHDEETVLETSLELDEDEIEARRYEQKLREWEKTRKSNNLSSTIGIILSLIAIIICIYNIILEYKNYTEEYTVWIVTIIPVVFILITCIYMKKDKNILTFEHQFLLKKVLNYLMKNYH